MSLILHVHKFFFRKVLYSQLCFTEWCNCFDLCSVTPLSLYWVACVPDWSKNEFLWHNGELTRVITYQVHFILFGFIRFQNFFFFTLLYLVLYRIRKIYTRKAKARGLNGWRFLLEYKLKISTWRFLLEDFYLNTNWRFLLEYK